MSATQDHDLAAAAFARGDYRTARELYLRLPPDERPPERMNALAVDRVSVYFGLGTVLLIVVAFLLARFIP